MEGDIETIYDPNVISNSNFSAKRRIDKSKRLKSIKYMIKSSKKIFYIFIIAIIIFMFKLYSLSKKRQRKGLTDRILNLETIINIQQKKLNKTNEMILRLYNKISFNNQNKKFTEIINQKYKEEQNFFCDNL